MFRHRKTLSHANKLRDYSAIVQALPKHAPMFNDRVNKTSRVTPSGLKTEFQTYASLYNILV